MILRLLFAFLVFIGFRWLVKRLGRERVRQAGVGRPQARSGRMVRDRICETFLPVEDALSLTAGSTVHYFCSAVCRDRFVAGGGRKAAAP